MRNLLIPYMLLLTVGLTAQSDWENVFAQDNVRNFHGHMYQSAAQVNDCISLHGHDHHLLVAAIKLEATNLTHHILMQEELDFTTICEDKTILMYAIEYGDARTVKLLIKHGADPKQLSTKGKTAWDYANKLNKPVIAGYLKSLK